MATSNRQMQRVARRALLRLQACLLERRYGSEHTVRVAAVVCTIAAIGGFICDSIKPFWWPEWTGYRCYGWKVYLIYAATNTIGAFAAYRAVHRVRDWFTVYFVVGLSLQLPGVLDNVIELGLMPLVWHGALGLFAAVTLAFCRFFEDVSARWSEVPVSGLSTDGAKLSLEVHKELTKEMQWAFTTYLQIWIAFTAIFGVSMSILFKDGNINKVDLKATAAQMVAAFLACLSISYWCGFARALRTMQDSRWSLVRRSIT